MMSKPINAHTAARRLFTGLASSATLALFASPAPAAVAPAAERDAELLRLADQILALDDEANR